MKINLPLVICFLLITHFSFSITPSEDIWGPTGHRATGAIAEKHLTRRAKRKIKKLLQGESLAFASTYADEIKSDSKYREFYPWHYVNMPLDGNYETCLLYTSPSPRDA